MILMKDVFVKMMFNILKTYITLLSKRMKIEKVERVVANLNMLYI